MTWKLNKTEQRIHDTLLTKGEFSPEGDRELRAMGKVADATNFGGGCGQLRGVIFNTAAYRMGDNYIYMKVEKVISLYESHWDVREPAGSQAIIIRQ